MLSIVVHTQVVRLKLYTLLGCQLLVKLLACYLSSEALSSGT